MPEGISTPGLSEQDLDTATDAEINAEVDTRPANEVPEEERFADNHTTSIMERGLASPYGTSSEANKDKQPVDTEKEAA